MFPYGHCGAFFTIPAWSFQSAPQVGHVEGAAKPSPARSKVTSLWHLSQVNPRTGDPIEAHEVLSERQES